MLSIPSAVTFLSRLKIRHRETGEIVPFIPNFNQKRMFNMLHERAESGHPLPYWAIICKARRVGVSSGLEGLLLANSVAHANRTALVVAHLATTSNALFSVPMGFLPYLPFSVPTPTKTAIRLPHKDGDSVLSIATAGTVVAGRGITITDLHISEGAYIPSGGGSFTSLIPAIIRNRSSMCFIESTANGTTGEGKEFYRYWEAAIRGENEFLPVFLSWLDDIGCRRDASEVTGDLDDDEKDILSLSGCSSKCRACAACHTALQSIAWRRWAIPNLCQIYVERFHQEYPVTASEAFTTTSYPAFTRDEIRAARATVSSPTYEGSLAKGSEVNPDDQTSVMNNNIVFTKGTRGGSPLKIWSLPAPGNHYYIGADVARGLQTGDYSACVVWCGETGEQVARYSNKVGVEPFAFLLNLLGRFYNNALLSIELTGNLGVWCQKVIRDTYNYPNIYRWKGRDDKIPVPFAPPRSLGWETTFRTRDFLLAAFRDSVKYGRAIVRDAITLEQMEAAGMDTVGRWEVDADTHDDILMAAMIGWLARVQYFTGTRHSATHLPTDFSSPAALEKAAETNPRVIISSADGDVEAASRRHWNRLSRLIRSGRTKPIDRLEGV